MHGNFQSQCFSVIIPPNNFEKQVSIIIFRIPIFVPFPMYVIQYVVAAKASGDLISSRLMASLSSFQVQDIRIGGISLFMRYQFLMIIVIYPKNCLYTVL